MLQKSLKVNWGLVQLVVVMFLLLAYAAIEGAPIEKASSGKRAYIKKTDASGKDRANMQLLTKE
jgi:hypothetical protein